MRRGQIHVSRELMQTDEWPLIENELAKVFTLEAKESLPFGVIAFHGTSYLFDESLELASPQYDCLFKAVDGKPVFDKFVKCD